MVPVASLSAPSLLPPVASRCFCLLLVPCGLAFGSVFVASRCLPLLVPPACPLWPRFRIRLCCLPLPPVTFCLNFFGAARASFSRTFHSRMKSWPQSFFRITGHRWGRAKGGPEAPLYPLQASFREARPPRCPFILESVREKPGSYIHGFTREKPRSYIHGITRAKPGSYIHSMFLLSVWGRCRYNFFCRFVQLSTGAIFICLAA